MKKINVCRKAEKLRSGGRPGAAESLAAHIDVCAECLEAKKVSEWMRKFAADAAPGPENLRAPGFLLLKASLRRRQIDAGRAVLPIRWMQAASIVMLLVGVVWLEIKSDAPIFSTMTDAFLLLAKAAPILIAALAGAGLICFVLAYKMRGTKPSRTNF